MLAACNNATSSTPPLWPPIGRRLVPSKQAHHKTAGRGIARGRYPLPPPPPPPPPPPRLINDRSPTLSPLSLPLPAVLKLETAAWNTRPMKPCFERPRFLLPPHNRVLLARNEAFKVQLQRGKKCLYVSLNSSGHGEGGHMQSYCETARLRRFIVTRQLGFHGASGCCLLLSTVLFVLTNLCFEFVSRT